MFRDHGRGTILRAGHGPKECQGRPCSCREGRRAPGTAAARRPDPGARVTTPLIKPLYTARATATGGRAGHAVSDDGILDVDLRPPKEMGGPGGATNPEQLFATGYAA